MCISWSLTGIYSCGSPHPFRATHRGGGVTPASPVGVHGDKGIPITGLPIRSRGGTQLGPSQASVTASASHPLARPLRWLSSGSKPRRSGHKSCVQPLHHTASTSGVFCIAVVVLMFESSDDPSCQHEHSLRMVGESPPPAYPALAPAIPPIPSTTRTSATLTPSTPPTPQREGGGGMQKSPGKPQRACPAATHKTFMFLRHAGCVERRQRARNTHTRGLLRSRRIGSLQMGEE